MTLNSLKKLLTTRFNTAKAGVKKTAIEVKIPMTVETLSQSTLVYKALFKAFIGILSPKIWFLSLMPLLIAVVLWAGLWFFLWDTMVLILSNVVSSVESPTWLPTWLPTKTVWISLIILLLSLPLVMMTALLLVNTLGTQTVAQRVAKQYNVPLIKYSVLESSANTISSIWHSIWILIVLGFLWMLSLPTWFVPGLGLIIQFLLMAWANTRLFSRDVLLDFADKSTRDAVIKIHKNTLFGLGLMTSIPAFLPSMLWLSGGILIVFLPLIVLLTVWVSIMIFLAASLLFSHYLIPALLHYQHEQLALKVNLDAQIKGEIIESKITERKDTVNMINTIR
jgi:hypothetical protein